MSAAGKGNVALIHESQKVVWSNCHFQNVLPVAETWSLDRFANVVPSAVCFAWFGAKFCF